MIILDRFSLKFTMGLPRQGMVVGILFILQTHPHPFMKLLKSLEKGAYTVYRKTLVGRGCVRVAAHPHTIAINLIVLNLYIAFFSCSSPTYTLLHHHEKYITQTSISTLVINTFLACKNVIIETKYFRPFCSLKV